MRLVSTSSEALNWVLPFKKGGIFNFTPSKVKSSSMSKPLSAITESPRSNAPKRPDRRVNSLSEMLPGYKSDTNITAPEGEMRDKSFIGIMIVGEC